MSAASRFIQSHRFRQAPQFVRTEQSLPVSTAFGRLKFHLLLLFSSALSWAFLSPSACLMFSGCVVGCGYVWLATIEARRGALWLNPLSLFFLFYGL